MGVVETLMTRNAEQATGTFVPGLRMMPVLRTIVIACVDPRVDPLAVLGAEPGELAVIRNVGGRVTPDVLDALALLRSVTQAAGSDLGAGWELIVLQHTDCGITRLLSESAAGPLASYLGVDADGLDALHVADPSAAVAADLVALAAESRIGAGARLSGLVYDVATGLLDRVPA